MFEIRDKYRIFEIRKMTDAEHAYVCYCLNDSDKWNMLMHYGNMMYVVIEYVDEVYNKVTIPGISYSFNYRR